MKNMKKILVLAVAALLLVAVSVAGTLAWLQDSSEIVENTFSPNNIQVDIAESDIDGDTNTLKNAYELIPGVNITKDPTVTVTTSVDAYVFIKETKTNWPAKAMYSLTSVWNALGDSYPGVYYTTVSGQETAHTIGVINNNLITVPSDMTGSEMPSAAATLSYQAWAIQMVNGQNTTFTPENAWKELSDQ